MFMYVPVCVCADMAIHNVIGDSFRGATWVSIHNGGGTGWGESVNGGFGFVAGSLRSLLLARAPARAAFVCVPCARGCVIWEDPLLSCRCVVANSMVLDGSLDADRRAKSMLHWDVYNGVRVLGLMGSGVLARLKLLPV